MQCHAVPDCEPMCLHVVGAHDHPGAMQLTR
jgi:hypothetical protein